MAEAVEASEKGADERPASEPVAHGGQEREREREREWRRRNPELAPLMRNSAARASSRTELPWRSELNASAVANHSPAASASGANATAAPRHPS